MHRHGRPSRRVVDLSQDDNEEHADREDQDVGVLQDDVRQVARREEGVRVEQNRATMATNAMKMPP